MLNISAQKYKIWINTSWLVLISQKDFKILTPGLHPILCILNEPDTSVIQSYMDRMLRGVIDFPVIVITKRKKTVWQSILKNTPMVYAAGGLIRRGDGKYLFIQRRGWWDLPKGKLDKGETNRQAAIREVLEEVGLTCTIRTVLPFTYHCYKEKNNLVIKQTAWYDMLAKSNTLKLQKEEDITHSKWVPKKKLKNMQLKVYPNLRALLTTV